MSTFVNSIQRYIKLGGFWATRSQFYRDLANSQDGRELLRDFIDGEWQITSAPATSDRTRAAGLGYMRTLMENGITGLDAILRQTMPAGDAMGIRVIADAHDKSAALRSVADNVDQQAAMNAVVRKALVSPALLLPIAFVFSFVMASFVIPAFEKSAPPEVWVGYSYLVRAVAIGFRNYGLLAIGAIAILMMWFTLYGLENITASWRYKAENATGGAALPWLLLGPIKPMLTMYRDTQSARMLANLATLLQSGRGLQDALHELAESTSPWMKRHLLVVLESLHLNPGDYVLAFGHGVLSKAVLTRLHTLVRLDSGRDFSVVLVEIGTSGQEAARKALTSYATKLNVILLALVLGIVVFFYGGQMWISWQIQDETSPSKIQARTLKRRQTPPVPVSLNTPLPSSTQPTLQEKFT